MLHIIFTQGKSNKARTITMVKFRLGHLTITMLLFYVNPYKRKATFLPMSCKIWKFHTMIHSIKYLLHYYKKHLYGYQLFDIHYKNLILKLHQYLVKYVQARMDNYLCKIQICFTPLCIIMCPKSNSFWILWKIITQICDYYVIF